ncbi:MAG: phenylalanine--tRNA ligase subunit beta, partial [Nanoarchaeota archaeon]
MPTVTLNRKTFEKLLGKKLPTEKLKDRISYLGTDLESVTDSEIVVEIFPNRPDMLSEQGLARAMKSFLGIKTGLVPYTVTKGKGEVIIEKAVEHVRPYTACAIVRGMKFDDEKIRELIQIQEKLHITHCRNRRKAAIGIYPLEKIALPIRYTAKKAEDIVFRPLESAKRMNAKQMLTLHPAGRDYGYLLEGMAMFPVFIDENDEVLSVPPIINSHQTGKVSATTTDVFVECSGFDHDVLHTLLVIILTAMADMGGKIEEMTLRYPTKKVICPDFTPKKMKLDAEAVNKLLGLSLSESEIHGHLKQMGYGVEKGYVLIPRYRADIQHPWDLIEDIAIAYGYENIEESPPGFFTAAEEDPFVKFVNKVAGVLVGYGLLEVNAYHLSSKKVQATDMMVNDRSIHLEGSLNAEYDVLRAWLIPQLLEILSKNKHHESPQHIFDVGVTFSQKGEMTRVAVALCNHDADFTLIKQHFDGLMRALDLKYELAEVE